MTELPLPLTPPECDLRDYPWMPIDCTRLLTSETWMLGTDSERVAALTLWIKSWHQQPAGSLPDNDRMLAVLSDNARGWGKVREHAMRGWIKCSDGRLYHPVVCEKAAEAWALKLAQRARTEAARAARKAGRNSVTETQGTHATEDVTMSVTDASNPLSQSEDVLSQPLSQSENGSTLPYQTRQELKEESKKDYFLNSLPREADAGLASTPPPAPQWPPDPHPSAVTATVGQVVAKLEGRHRDTRLPGPAKPIRTVEEQLQVLGGARRRNNVLTTEELAQARAALVKRAEVGA